MIIINSRLPTQNLKIAKSLSKLIQGYIYSYLPKAEHDGYTHKESGKNFKRSNFDFRLNDLSLEIRFSSFVPEFEKTIAFAVLKDGLKLGNIYLLDTSVSVKEHRISQNEATFQGCVACSVVGLLGYKVHLEPQDSRHLEMMKTNALQRFETLMGYKYEGEFELNLLWQNLQKPFYFYYGNNNMPMKAWPAKWYIKAKPELINLILDVGVGSGCMNCGLGFLEVVEEKQAM